MPTHLAKGGHPRNQRHHASSVAFCSIIDGRHQAKPSQKGSKRNNSTSHTGRKVTQAPHERHNKLSNTSWLMLENFNKTFVDNGSNRMKSSKP
jgi:hypothetical protein